MDRMEALGLAIREERQRLNISQEKLAATAKLHRNVIGLVERNATAPTLNSLFALADALNVPASQLVARAEEIADQVGASGLNGGGSEINPTDFHL